MLVAIAIAIVIVIVIAIVIAIVFPTTAIAVISKPNNLSTFYIDLEKQPTGQS